MKKKLFSLILVLMLCVALACPAAAAGEGLLVDEADLLTPTEEAALLEKLSELSRTYQVEVVIATVLDTGAYSPDAFVEYFYDSRGYGYGASRDGVLLVVDMGSRNYRILSNGLAADAITMGDIDSIGDVIAPELSDGDYADAFAAFADECEFYINGHINGFPFEFGANLLIALVIGLVAALIVTGIMRGQLKSVRRKSAAGDYMKQGSLRITNANELFLYRNVSRQAKPKNSSGSGRSGGSSRNVGGGRF